MAWTNWGFDGTINESQWAQMAGLLGNGYVALDSSSCVTTAVAGARSVSVSAGTLFGDGVVSVSNAAETVAMTTPVNGQWYVIALRRTWATNTVALVAIAGATTSTTTPTAPPSTLPTLNTDTGVLTDQPIAWAWCNSANTTVVVFDMRQFPVRTMPPTVASAAVRDGKFTLPVQGMQIWRDDLGAVETYYDLYNAVTNPGGRDSAGWYTDTRAMGLVPIKPSTVTFVTGSGSVKSLGQISFTGCTSVNIDGVFSNAYKNYKTIIKVDSASATTDINLRFRVSGADNSTVNYQNVRVNADSGGVVNVTAGTFTGASIGSTTATSGCSINLEIQDAFDAIPTRLILNYAGGITGGTHTSHGGVKQGQSLSFTGFTVYSAAANFSGYLQVFGYND